MEEALILERMRDDRQLSRVISSPSSEAQNREQHILVTIRGLLLQEDLTIGKGFRQRHPNRPTPISERIEVTLRLAQVGVLRIGRTARECNEGVCIGELHGSEGVLQKGLVLAGFGRCALLERLQGPGVLIAGVGAGGAVVDGVAAEDY